MRIWTRSRSEPLLSLPPRSGGEGSRVGGGAANAAVSEFTDRPPTPPRHALCARREGRRKSSLRAKRSNPWRNTCRTMDCFVASLLAMTEDMSPHPRGAIRPSFANNLPPSSSEGAGNAGRPMRPQPRVRTGSKKAHALVRSHRNHPAFPTQWF
jgi:hypothetical protein